MKLRPPSPALAISIIALVAACTGSAVAATVITSKQIKNGTIQGLDIKNATISSNKLTQGTQNLLNKKSAAATGAHVAYEATRKAGPEAQPANVIVKVATLTVPAGAWVVQANTIMTAFTARRTRSRRCSAHRARSAARARLIPAARRTRRPARSSSTTARRRRRCRCR